MRKGRPLISLTLTFPTILGLTGLIILLLFLGLTGTLLFSGAESGAGNPRVPQRRGEGVLVAQGAERGASTRPPATPEKAF
jgi:hypothetical protein